MGVTTTFIFIQKTIKLPKTTLHFYNWPAHAEPSVPRTAELCILRDAQLVLCHLYAAVLCRTDCCSGSARPQRQLSHRPPRQWPLCRRPSNPSHGGVRRLPGSKSIPRTDSTSVLIIPMCRPSPTASDRRAILTALACVPALFWCYTRRGAGYYKSIQIHS